jgi:hypothetical protein
MSAEVACRTSGALSLRGRFPGPYGPGYPMPPLRGWCVRVLKVCVALRAG